ncbi:MAG: exodeoxyribonuclease VII small subunit [Syntrophomonadaceae bacterium]|jgi:exodeoxyribonuclease VII small subunit|nr:exodeoxyribonuclease VII small subunit [Syntrophomonadaceae bacterium]
MVKNEIPLTFEEALTKLEQITEHMESGSAGLAESLSAFQEGMKLVVFCQNELEKAEGTIKELMENVFGDLEMTDFIEKNRD